MAKTRSAVKAAAKEPEHDLQLPSSSEESGSEGESEELSSSEESGDESDENEETENNKQSVKPTEKASKTGSHVVNIQKTSNEARKTDKSKNKRGVIYVGRLPHGLYEKEMRQYFDQFGEISRLRISRNKKTGKSKHYGFIEFQNKEVAKIACEAMNNYLVFGHMLQVQMVEEANVHDELFSGHHVQYKPLPHKSISRHRHDAPKTKDQWEKLEAKQKQRKEIRKKKLAAAGIDFE
ncbi:hypothetical protein JA9_003068 [Meyerozyma sp. JA9]|nr:hypothetical protein JA9_003068 [Meyerozyma sp. JA9]